MVQSVGDQLPDVLLRIQAGAALVDIGDLHRLADPQLAGVRRLLADDHPEQGRLADAVGSHDADDAGPGQGEAQAVEEQPITEALDQLLRVQHVAAQPRARRDVDLLEVELAVAVGLGGQLLVAGQPRLVLGLPRLGIGPRPFQLTLQDLGPLGVALALDLKP